MVALRIVNGDDKIVPVPHMQEWCDRLQRHRFTVTVAPRGFLKSTLLGAYLAWRLATLRSGNFSAIYFSAKRELAMEHLRVHKSVIDTCIQLGYLPGVESLTDAGSVLFYQKGQFTFRVVPEGIKAAARGYHVDAIMLDDVLKDPENPMKPTEIIKVNEIFRRKIVPMLRSTSTVYHVVGTPIAEGDLLDELSKVNFVNYKVYRAMPAPGQSLWPEKFPPEKLLEIKALQQDPRAFAIEYLCEPARLGQSYIESSLYEEAMRWV